MDTGKGLLVRKDWFEDILLFSGVAVLFFWALGSRGLWAAEGRWAQITREMLITGDFFHPSIGGREYFDKPLLTYWFIAIVSFISRNLNEWTVRIPSALAGALSILATKNLGTRLWSVKVGRIAAWILLTCYGVVFWSRTATAEAEHMAAIILAVAWYWARRNKAGFLSYLVFYIIIFAGAMTKGLAAVVIPVLVIIPDLLGNKRWRIIYSPSHILALLLGVGFYLAPSIYSNLTQPDQYESTSLGLVFRENVIRYFKPFDHKGPVYQYLYSIPALMFPWAPLWVAAVCGCVRAWKYLDENSRWLVKAIGLIFLFFTISGSRRSYYILPLVPFGCLLIAVFSELVKEKQIEGFRRWGFDIQNGLMFVLLTAFAIGPFLVAKMNIELSSKVYAVWATVALVAIAVLVILRMLFKLGQIKSRADIVIASNVAVTLVLFAGYFCFMKPMLDSHRTHKSFAMELKEKISQWDEESIGMLYRGDSKMLFYLDREKPVRIVEGDDELREFLESGKSRILIAQVRDLMHFGKDVIAGLQKEPDMKEFINKWDNKDSRERKWAAWILND